MASAPTAPAAISAALAAGDGRVRLQLAGAILDRLDQLADREGSRVSYESCDALFEALQGENTSTVARWLADRRPASRPSLYLQARLSQTAGDPAAAAEHWDALFRGTAPTDPDVLLQYARVLAGVGRVGEAAERLRQALRSRPPYSFYPRIRTLLDRLWLAAPPAARRARIAIIGSSTTSIVAQVLRALCFRDGVNATFYEGPYGAHRQEVLDPDSGLYRFAPTLTFVLANWRDLQLPPQVEDEAAVVDAVVVEHTAAWRRLNDTAGCHVVQHGFDLPAEESHDALAVRPGGRSRVIRLINQALAAQAPGHVSILDAEAVQAEVGRPQWQNAALWWTARQHPAPDAVPALAELQMAHVRAVLGLARKVVVCDLDNTVWGGVIGEDGLAGIELGPGSPAGEAYAALQDYLLELKRRGVLLAVCSKNNPDDARLPFTDHPQTRLRLDDFAAFFANWSDKAENLRAMAAQLALGLDSFVFLDDNPVERAWVRAQLPEVAVVELGPTPFTYVRDLDRGRHFQTVGLSDEDRGRSEMYRQGAARDAARTAYGSLDEFLAQLDMRASAVAIATANIGRVTHLLTTPNHFTLTTRRDTEAQVASLAAVPDGWARAFHLADRFGDHGLIGVLVCAPAPQDSWAIDTWLMSCRVLGRGMEHFMFDRLCDAARAAGITSIVGVYRPTAKNAQVADLFTRLGFRRSAEQPDEVRYLFDVAAGAVGPGAQASLGRHIRAEEPAPRGIRLASG
jgi:FkbH-like protein